VVLWLVDDVHGSAAAPAVDGRPRRVVRAGRPRAARRGHKPHEKAVARHLLEELGFDPGLVDQAIADPTTSDEVMDDHRRVVAAGGYGVPTMFFPMGSAFSAQCSSIHPPATRPCDCGMPSPPGRSFPTYTNCNGRRHLPTNS
jgi:hypothetical protein